MSHQYRHDGTILYDDGTVVPPDPLVVLAQTHPGIVRTLAVLRGELADADLPAPERKDLAEHLRELADGVDSVVIIDAGLPAERLAEEQAGDTR